MAVPREQQEEMPYPPGQRDHGDCSGRVLPPLPNTPFIKATLHCTLGTVLTLAKLLGEDLTVRIDAQVSVGYDRCPQAVLGTVLGGPKSMKKRTFLFKFYDPLYLNPDNVFTASLFPGPSILANPFSDPKRLEKRRPRSADSEILDPSTLAASLILSRKDLVKKCVPIPDTSPDHSDQPLASTSHAPECLDPPTYDVAASSSPLEISIESQDKGKVTAEVGGSACSFLKAFVDFIRLGRKRIIGVKKIWTKLQERRRE
jgi:hypothetical protein